MVKILCVSDHIDPLVYTTGIRERFGDVDLVLSAGDLPLDYYDFIVSNLNKPLLFVFGNHNLRRMHLYRRSRDCFEAVRDVGNFSAMHYGVGARYVNLKVVREKGLLVAGLGGTRLYNRQANQFSETHMFFRMLRLVPHMLWNRVAHGRFVDIVLTHAPPYGVNDMPDVCHRGFKTFGWLISRFRPRYLVHGHVHLYDRNALREQVVGDTRVVNAYDHVVITMEPQRLPRRRNRRRNKALKNSRIRRQSRGFRSSSRRANPSESSS